MSSLPKQQRGTAPECQPQRSTPRIDLSRFCEQRRAHEALALLLCIVCGVLISTLPHLVWWARTGSPVWIADNDELVYLSTASQAYFNHPTRLGDPLLAGGGTGVMFPWLQFAPGVLSAKLLHIGPMHIGILWRIWAGLSIGVTWFLLVRLLAGRLRPALWISLIMIGDIGLLTARPVVRQFVLALQLLSGRSAEIFSQNPQIHVQWRLMTPGLSMAFLLLHLWLVGRAREHSSPARMIWSGIGFGLLFPAYFYLWTSAAAALVLAFLLDREYRRIYMHTFWIGLLCGAPAVASNFWLKHSNPPDWLLRSDNFLPVGHFAELLFPKIAILLAILLGLWVHYRRKHLTYLWCLAVGALLLMNHQILSGLQIQNFHWIYAWGPCINVMVLIAVWDMTASFRKSRLWIAALAAICVVHLATGFSLRVLESTRTKESQALTADYHRYAGQGSQAPLEPNAVLAGSMDFVDIAVVAENLRPLVHYCAIFSPSLTDDELDRRIALNSYLEGIDRTGFEASQQQLLSSTVWGVEARDASRRRERLQHRVASYDSIAAEPEAALRHFRVRYVAHKRGQPLPSSLNPAWTLLQDGPFWQVWAFTKL
jgi:hypothetical protein